MKTVYLVSLSGGKDSQACLQYMLENYKNKGIIQPYFCDTGWENKITYEHLGTIEREYGVQIDRIKSEKYDGFEDMCIKKKAIPSRVTRFCTEQLKVIPSQKYLKAWQAKDYRVINVVGVRADESDHKILKEPQIINGVKWRIMPRREGEQRWKFSFFTSSSPKKSDYKRGNGVVVLQPIVGWKEIDVYRYIMGAGYTMNPLYFTGRKRVGCDPCINAGVTEIGLLSKDAVARVAALEKSVSEAAGAPRFFYHLGGGKMISIKEMHRKHEHNPLGLDLGCINHLGVCE